MSDPRFISDCFEKAKGGRAVEMYGLVAPIHDSGSLPPANHYAFGWIVYYALHQTPDSEIRIRKRMLARYLRLSVPRPHKLHSMILTEAIRLRHDVSALASNRLRPLTGADNFSIVKFMEFWGLRNLRPGDWRRKEVNGNVLPSTVERLITQYADELVATKTPASPEIREIAERAFAENPGSDSLAAQLAEIHELAGERDRAVAMMRSAVLSAPTKFFHWSRLASLIESPQEAKLKIALLYKSLITPGQGNFKGKVRLALAETWISLGSFGAARFELEEVRRLYNANEWHLPRRFEGLEKQIPEGTQPVNPLPAYRRVEAMADDFIYSALPEVRMSKTYHKPPKPGGRFRPMAAWRVTDPEGRHYWFSPARFGIAEDLPEATAVIVRLHNERIVAASLAEA